MQDILIAIGIGLALVPLTVGIKRLMEQQHLSIFITRIPLFMIVLAGYATFNIWTTGSLAHSSPIALLIIPAIVIPSIFIEWLRKRSTNTLP